MKLAKPFFRLPVRFDAERLRAEIEALPASAWARHPNEIEGNSSLRLISADGGENDDVYGSMLPTPHLQQCPYVRQVLSSFGVVWSRSRLMRLDPHSSVPEHADINYHWFFRVRMHIPIVTRPEVSFHCDGQTVHMAPGEAWLFDNWRLHHVENPTETRASTSWPTPRAPRRSGSSSSQAGGGQLPPANLPYRPRADVPLLTEQVTPRPVMPPAEVELLLADFRGELAMRADTPEAREQLGRYHWLLQGFCFDWRQLYALHGEAAPGRPEFRELVEALRTHSRELRRRTRHANQRRRGAHGARRPAAASPRARRARIERAGAERPCVSRGSARASARRARSCGEPVFIVAAPRSGSTLLFETLSVTPQLWTVAGEAHWLVESIPELRPGAPGVDSNRLTAAHCSDAIARRIEDELLENLRDPRGARAAGRSATTCACSRRRRRMRCGFRSSRGCSRMRASCSCGATRARTSPASSRPGDPASGRPTASSTAGTGRGRCCCRRVGSGCAAGRSRKSPRTSGTRPIASCSTISRRCRAIAGRR